MSAVAKIPIFAILLIFYVYIPNQFARNIPLGSSSMKHTKGNQSTRGYMEVINWVITKMPIYEDYSPVRYSDGRRSETAESQDDKSTKSYNSFDNTRKLGEGSGKAYSTEDTNPITIYIALTKTKIEEYTELIAQMFQKALSRFMPQHDNISPTTLNHGLLKVLERQDHKFGSPKWTKTAPDNGAPKKKTLIESFCDWYFMNVRGNPNIEAWVFL